MDNLARKDDILENNNVLSRDDSKSNILYINPHQKRIEEIRKTIDALLDIRLSLSISKLGGNTISISKLNEILNEQKEKEKDELVSKEIDELFKDIIPITKDPITKDDAISKVDKEIEKQTLSLEELENEMKSSYKESEGNDKGIARTLNNGHFKKENDNKE